MCITTNCYRSDTYAKGLCGSCYRKMQREAWSNTSAGSATGYASTQYFVECCGNGIVKELLESGFKVADLSEKFEVSTNSVQKYLRIYDLRQYSLHKRPLKSERTKPEDNLPMTPARKLALCSKWVKNDNLPRYYFHH